MHRAVSDCFVDHRCKVQVLGVGKRIVASLNGCLEAALVGLDGRRVTTVFKALAFVAGVSLLL
ncbi:unannotated protein [freshwater metagenome]|uniref:Unannotated protein n=1 Tax=freshwater metagenome TaxID=449393 RepID=A0A6J6A397_9ZZZZ